jgi:hypothetical protein
VRTWQGVLARRDPDWAAWDDDDHEEAREAQRIHELRGLVMAQVAEIEDLLRYTLVQSQRVTSGRGSRVRRLGPITAGNALALVEALLRDLNLRERYKDHLATVRAMVRRRNQLVHARVHIGFSQLGPEAPRVSVISLLLGLTDEPQDLSSPGSQQSMEGADDEDNGEIDEVILTRDMERAYEALDAALDIWEAVLTQLRPARQ